MKIITVLMLALALVSCKDKNLERELALVSSERDQLVEKIVRLELMLEAKPEDLKEALEELNAATLLIEDLRSTITDLKSKMREKDSQIDDLSTIKRERHANRIADKGLKFETLETVNGVVYTDVTITDFDPARVNIRHSEGTRGILYSDLKPEHRNRWEYPENEQQAHLERSQAQQEAFMAKHSVAPEEKPSGIVNKPPSQRKESGVVTPRGNFLAVRQTGSRPNTRENNFQPKKVAITVGPANVRISLSGSGASFVVPAGERKVVEVWVGKKYSFTARDASTGKVLDREAWNNKTGLGSDQYQLR